MFFFFFLMGCVLSFVGWAVHYSAFSRLPWTNNKIKKLGGWMWPFDPLMIIKFRIKLMRSVVVLLDTGKKELLICICKPSNWCKDGQIYLAWRGANSPLWLPRELQLVGYWIPVFSGGNIILTSSFIVSHSEVAAWLSTSKNTHLFFAEIFFIYLRII